MENPKKFLYLLSFITGFSVLSLEILGFRMFAPYFGYSIYVSGSIIGIILTTLTIGYYFGGMLADKKPEIKYMLNLVLLSDIYLFIIALMYNRILEFLSKGDLILGTITAALIIFGIPMVLLSTVSPYLIKNLSSKKNIGRTSGRISAMSTLGNIAGVFTTTFIFIPKIGTHKTIYILAITLLLICLYALFRESKKYLLLLFILLLINPKITLGSTKNVIYEEESVYNILKVTEQNNEKFLILNNDKWVHSIENKNNVLVNRYYDLFNLAPIITDAKSALLLGMGAGTNIKQYRNFFPNLEIDAVEIDSKVIEVGYNYFNIPKEDIKTRIYTEDAKSFVKRSNKKYDVIVLDFYAGDIYIPFYLTTKEFFQNLKEHLTENGVIIMNVIRLPSHEREDDVYKVISNTIVSVFPSTFVLKIPQDNAIVIATKKQTTKEEIIKKLKENKIKEVEGIIKFSINLIEEVKQNKDITILTDDKSNIEEITYQMYQESDYK